MRSWGNVCTYLNWVVVFVHVWVRIQFTVYFVVEHSQIVDSVLDQLHLVSFIPWVRRIPNMSILLLDRWAILSVRPWIYLEMSLLRHDFLFRNSTRANWNLTSVTVDDVWCLWKPVGTRLVATHLGLFLPIVWILKLILVSLVKQWILRRWRLEWETTLHS